MDQEDKRSAYYGRSLRIAAIQEPVPTSKTHQEWAKHYFPSLFTRPFTAYQKEFWNWGWDVEPDVKYRPRVECEPRGVGKSTNAEALIAALVARKKRKMIGYVSLEEEKAQKHFDAIKAMLETPAFLVDYPHCKPKVQTLRNTAAQWSRDALITDDDSMIVPLSLQGSSRGWKSPVGTRFDVIVLDDIDKLGMSIQFVRKLLELLKGEILAAGDDKTLVFMPQNLVYRDSICSMIYDHRADILSDRIFCGPYPLLVDYDAEKVDIEGDHNNAKTWVITRGTAFDEAIPISYAQSLLNQFGKGTFDRECQQDVHRVDDDKDFREWNEPYHIITYSEFVDFFARHKVNVWNTSRRHPMIPQNWNVGLGLDWGTTLAHPTAMIAAARPPEGSPLNDSFFCFSEVVLPKFPHIAGEDPELVSPGRVAKAILDALKVWNVPWSQVRQHLMSHEASAALNTMRIDLEDDLKVFFNKWKPKRGSGVPQVQNLLEINYDFPHPFRSELQGRPRIYFVVPDEQGELVYGDLGRLTLAQPTDSRGFARARYEFPLYSHLNTGANKLDDDLVDALLGLANVFMISSDPKTKIEIREDAMPENLKLDALEDLIVEENIELAERVVLARMIKFGEMDKKEDDARANMSRYRPSVPRMRTRSPRRFS
jgi:hypothetical protein